MSWRSPGNNRTFPTVIRRQCISKTKGPVIHLAAGQKATVVRADRKQRVNEEQR